jgi:hypothetical protein
MAELNTPEQNILHGVRTPYELLAECLEGSDKVGRAHHPK